MKKRLYIKEYAIMLIAIMLTPTMSAQALERNPEQRKGPAGVGMLFEKPVAKPAAKSTYAFILYLIEMISGNKVGASKIDKKNLKDVLAVAINILPEDTPEDSGNKKYAIELFERENLYGTGSFEKTISELPHVFELTADCQKEEVWYKEKILQLQAQFKEKNKIPVALKEVASSLDAFAFALKSNSPAAILQEKFDAYGRARTHLKGVIENLGGKNAKLKVNFTFKTPDFDQLANNKIGAVKGV